MSEKNWNPSLSGDERKTLLKIVRNTLVWCANGHPGEFRVEDYGLTPALREPVATFVTLKLGGALRGCIGAVEADAPMCVSVHYNAANAALKDHRFPPLTLVEAYEVSIHVSLLSPPETIPSVESIRLGEHGVVIERGRNRGVFLPEVPVEQGWNREELLSELGLKAGMDAEAWQRGARLSVFRTVVLQEE